MLEQEIVVKTPDGTLDTFVVQPEENGPHPVIVIYMDAPGIRDELREMASRLASVGYLVALPNLYYRVGREGHYGYDLTKIRSDESHQKRMHECRLSLTNAGIVSDTEALLPALRALPGAADGPIGCVGYCMSGKFVIAVAAALGTQVAAIASFYGVGIVSDEPDSPHHDAAKVTAETYLAFASDDPWVPGEVLEALPGIIKQTGWNARIEMYPDTTHGFAFPSRADYNQAAGERHWERIHSMMARNLGG
ncbi:MAG: dienelactone hydrolase family protein [Burkholderiaceae bacterium]